MTVNKWTSLKDQTVDLSPLSYVIEIVDGYPRSIVFSRDGVAILRAESGSYGSGMTITIPAPPVKVKRWRLTFKLGGTEHTSDHEERYEADDAAAQLGHGVERSISEVEVEA